MSQADGPMPDISYEVRGHTAYITIRRPQAMNSLGPEQQAEIIGVWETFRDDPAAWVAIITGEGDRAFCAGADLKTYNAIAGRAGYLRPAAGRRPSGVRRHHARAEHLETDHRGG